MTGAAAFPRLLAVLRSLYGAQAAVDPAAGPILQAWLKAMDGVTSATQQPTPVKKPACVLLPHALEAARRGPLALLAEAFAAVEPALAWTQNPNYSDAKMGAGYMQGYAYANVIGPGGLVEPPGVMAGVLLLGPHRLYPDHSHPAAEVYHVLAGEAEWRQSGGPWVRRKPGVAIAHAPFVSHATKIADQVLLAFYCWQGDVKTYADLVPSPSGVVKGS